MLNGGVPEKRERGGILSLIAYVLCLLMLILIWLAETGNLPGEYNKPVRPMAHGIMLGIASLLATIGGFIALLLALLPRWDRPFWERAVRRFPFGMFPIMGLALIGSMFSVHTWYNSGFAMGTERDITDRRIPNGRECRTVHDGTFTSFGVNFTRKGDRQSQVDRMRQEFA